MRVWQTTKTTFKVSDFVGWYRSGQLTLNPDFQRRSVWRPHQKSYLIDTILRGLPVPMLFLRDLAADLNTFEVKREVVDGQQRLRTVIAFVAPNLLADKEPRDDFKILRSHNADLSGKRFEDLPKENKSQLLNYEFSVNVLPSDTDDREVKQIFVRMNSSGYKLNQQELRNARFFGPFKTLADSLATSQFTRWKDWGIFTTDQIARMDEIALTSELMMLMMHGVKGQSATAIEAAYQDNDTDDSMSEAPEIERRFLRVFELIEQEFRGDIVKFRRRSIFYGLFAAVYDLAYGLGSALKPTKSRSIPAKGFSQIREAATRIFTREAPTPVLDATTRRVGHSKERKTLIAYLRGS